jgi:hypothetical protein
MEEHATSQRSSVLQIGRAKRLVARPEKGTVNAVAPSGMKPAYPRILIAGLTAMVACTPIVVDNSAPQNDAGAQDASQLDAGSGGDAAGDASQLVDATAESAADSADSAPDALSYWELSAHSYDNGARPSVAVTGNLAIEVHQASSLTVGPLWYRTATLTGAPVPTWTWSSPEHYGDGVNPAIAAYGDSIIEVHQTTVDVSTLSYRTGHINADGTVIWSNSVVYDRGVKPSVALFATQVVEVHQASTGVGPLWYHSGVLNNDGTVTWSPGQQTDDGLNPSVTIYGSDVLEVHQGGVGVSGLWYQFGSVGSGALLWQDAAHQYGVGELPAVTYLTCTSFMEIHEKGDNTLWAHEGTSNCGGLPNWAPSIYQLSNGSMPTIAAAALGDGGVNALEAHQTDSDAGPLWARGYFVPQRP